MHYVNVTGIDPGLVHTGVVNITLDPTGLEYSIKYEVFDGITPAAIDKIQRWTEENWAAHTFIEAYRPRSHFSTDAEMGAAVNELARRIPRARKLDNTGVKQVVKPDLMQLLGVWRFATTTHHQDLRSAARIGLYGLLKDPDMNQTLALFVRQSIDGPLWTKL